MPAHLVLAIFATIKYMQLFLFFCLPVCERLGLSLIFSLSLFIFKAFLSFLFQ